MGANSQIEWTDNTFNPWWGCVAVSEACRNCYAEAFDHRLGGKHWGVGSPRKFFGDKHWAQPLAWDRAAYAAGERRRVFCASMADVFEDRRDLDEHRARLFKLIAATPSLEWLLLTKRIDVAMSMVPDSWIDGFPPNVSLGTTIENQRAADERLPELLACRHLVSTLFLSMEPLLEHVDISRALDARWCVCGADLDRATNGCPRCEWLWTPGQPAVDWVIVGGESGAGARPMHPDLARSIRDQCTSAGVPFFFKQWGDHAPAGSPPEFMVRLGKKAAGRELDGRTWDELPRTWRRRVA